MNIKVKQGKSDYDAFHSRKLQVFFENVVSLNILKYPYPLPLIVPVRHR